MAVEVLYLVRHSKAEGSHPRGDRHRSLADEGRARVAAMVPEAVSRGFDPDLALSSPYLRAQQTRELFLPAFGSDRLGTMASLVPEGDPREVLEDLRVWEAQGYARIALFTHNPLVTSLAEWVLASGLVSAPVFHTPTILAVHFDRGLEPRRGRPLWVLNP